MFKYISVILKQFTSKQKLKALAILLIAIAVIILGQSYLKEVDRTPEQMSNTITLQRKALFESQSQVYDLNKEINDLNDSIIYSNRECNDEALQRENYYTKKLLNQQKQFSEYIESISHNKTLPIHTMRRVKLDSLDLIQIMDTTNLTINKPNQ